MYRRAVVIPIRTCSAEQLRSVNQKLTDLSENRPSGDIAEIFALAAYLAGQAVQAAIALQGMPGADRETLLSVIDFWRTVSNHSHSAALACGGDNETLPGALVAFNFIQELTAGLAPACDGRAK